MLKGLIRPKVWCQNQRRTVRVMMCRIYNFVVCGVIIGGAGVNMGCGAKPSSAATLLMLMQRTHAAPSLSPMPLTGVLVLISIAVLVGLVATLYFQQGCQWQTPQVPTQGDLTRREREFA